MQRVKRTTAVAVLPAAPAGGVPGYFVAPNPAGGIPATVPGYEWYNSVQEELCAVIAAAGTALDITNTSQLLAALRAAGVFQTPPLGDRSTRAATMACFSQEYAAVHAGNGYQKLPSGLILQWGTYSVVTAGVAVPVTFPIAFPTGCYSVVVCQSSVSTATQSAWVSASPTTTGFSGSGTAAGGVAYWMAIGK